jgi:hypothetical protein
MRRRRGEYRLASEVGFECAPWEDVPRGKTPRHPRSVTYKDFARTQLADSVSF